jgi:hypothetical protein
MNSKPRAGTFSVRRNSGFWILDSYSPVQYHYYVVD